MRKRIWCKKFRITWIISHIWNIEMNMPHRKMSWKVYCPHFTVSWIMDDPERCHTSKLCPPMFLSGFNIHRKTNSKRIFIISDFNKSVMILKSFIWFLATSCKELTHWKRLQYWEGLGARREGDDREWDGWMASLTQWTWVWVNSGSWWWTGRPGVLRFMGSQRVGHDWATDLIWWKLLFYILTSVINVLVIQKSNMVICWNEHSIIKIYTCFIVWS